MFLLCLDIHLSSTVQPNEDNVVEIIFDLENNFSGIVEDDENHGETFVIDSEDGNNDGVDGISPALYNELDQSSNSAARHAPLRNELLITESDNDLPRIQNMSLVDGTSEHQLDETAFPSETSDTDARKKNKDYFSRERLPFLFLLKGVADLSVRIEFQVPTELNSESSNTDGK